LQNTPPRSAARLGADFGLRLELSINELLWVFICNVRSPTDFPGPVTHTSKSCGGGTRTPRQSPQDRPRPTGRDITLDARGYDLTSNRLLEMLPRTDLQTLSPSMTYVELAQGFLLFDPGEEVEQVYFPVSGMVSLVVVMQDGKAIEVATVGREGVVGAMAGLGLHHAKVRAIVQLPSSAYRISAAHLRRAAEASASITDLCIQYNEVLLDQARVTAACNALHLVEARLCRWLLQSRDRAESDTIMLTQEFLSDMLGVRRTSVTEVARKIQASGAISYSRGAIKILDLKALKELSCECYDTLREEKS
jgi:CRP-like cAMP-binding protein